MISQRQLTGARFLRLFSIISLFFFFSAIDHHVVKAQNSTTPAPSTTEAAPTTSSPTSPSPSNSPTAWLAPRPIFQLGQRLDFSALPQALGSVRKVDVAYDQKLSFSPSLEIGVTAATMNKTFDFLKFSPFMTNLEFCDPQRRFKPLGKTIYLVWSTEDAEEFKSQIASQNSQGAQHEDYPFYVFVLPQALVTLCGTVGVSYEEGKSIHAALSLPKGTLSSQHQQGIVNTDLIPFLTVHLTTYEYDIATFALPISANAKNSKNLQILELYAFSGQAVISEVLAKNVWCQQVIDGSVLLAEVNSATASSGTARTSPSLVASVGIPMPEMKFAFFDVWGNPAMTGQQNSHGHIRFATHPHYLMSEFLTRTNDASRKKLFYSNYDFSPSSLASTSSSNDNEEQSGGRHLIEIPVFSFFTAIRELTVVAPVTTNQLPPTEYVPMNGHVLSEVRFPNSNLNTADKGGSVVHASYYLLEPDFPGLMIGGKTERCRRFEMQAGPPQSLAIQPIGDFVPTHSSATHLDVFKIPKHNGIHFAAAMQDAAGNKVLLGSAALCHPHGVMTPVPTSSSAVDFHNDWSYSQGLCVTCSTTLDPSITAIEPVQAVTQSGKEAESFAVFKLNPAPASSGTEVPLHCVANATTSFNSLYNVGQSVSLNVVNSGDFNCYNASLPLETLFSSLENEDVGSVFFDPNLRSVPMAQVYVAADAPKGSNYLALDDELTHWMLVPRKGFIYIPLGLLSVMAFGASYTSVSSLRLNLSSSICQSAPLSNIEYQLASWLYRVGDNSSRYYRNLQPSSNPSQNIDFDLQVCYGSGLDTLEFVALTCCDRVGNCESSSSKSPVAILLIAGGVILSILLACLSAWYLWRTVNLLPVHITPRHHLDVSGISRVLLAHILAPFILFAHSYFIWDVRNTSAAVMFWIDIALPALWYIVSVVRVLAPLFVFTVPTYKFVGTLLLVYTEFVLMNCVIWTLSALHLNMRLLPYACASALTYIQFFWSVMWAADELRPNFLGSQTPQYSLVPIDAALAVEYFGISCLLFIFAVTQVTDITPFAAVGAAFVVILFGAIYNYSLSAQFSEAFKKYFGSDGSKGAGLVEKLVLASQKGRKPGSAGPGGTPGDGSISSNAMQGKSGGDHVLHHMANAFNDISQPLLSDRMEGDTEMSPINVHDKQVDAELADITGSPKRAQNIREDIIRRAATEFFQNMQQNGGGSGTPSSPVDQQQNGGNFPSSPLSLSKTNANSGNASAAPEKGKQPTPTTNNSHEPISSSGSSPITAPSPLSQKQSQSGNGSETVSPQQKVSTTSAAPTATTNTTPASSSSPEVQQSNNPTSPSGGAVSSSKTTTTTPHGNATSNVMTTNTHAAAAHVANTSSPAAPVNTGGVSSISAPKRKGNEANPETKHLLAKLAQDNMI